MDEAGGGNGPRQQRRLAGCLTCNQPAFKPETASRPAQLLLELLGEFDGRFAGEQATASEAAGCGSRRGRQPIRWSARGRGDARGRVDECRGCEQASDHASDGQSVHACPRGCAVPRL